MERLGIVGLPNSGKSGLFRALTGIDVEVAPHPFTTTGSNVGVAQVPDPRLDVLAELAKSRKVVRAGLNVIDIAGLAAGASHGEGLGNRFLAQIREVDAILYVLRAFEDAGVAYAIDPPDPLADLDVLETELCLTDLETIEARLPKARKGASDDTQKRVAAALEAAASALESGVPLYRSDLDPDMRALLREHFLLTDKKVLYVVNIGEDELAERQAVEAKIMSSVGEVDVTALCVALEDEIAQLDDPSERAELLAGYEIDEPALPRVARAAYHTLGKRTFFTTGDKESRAWTIREGDAAPAAAGVIHSDFERGFIRAEVIAYDDLVAAGGWDEAKRQGDTRLEGRDYVVSDGDVIEFRFNV
ncbi:MAG: redox-regulated ATPase YchF [Actinobacteria bacterium ATB1]|nr:redox-regulated ATPase YchF [Actinobacteria bacterium ATB1]